MAHKAKSADMLINRDLQKFISGESLMFCHPENIERAVNDVLHNGSLSWNKELQSLLLTYESMQSQNIGNYVNGYYALEGFLKNTVDIHERMEKKEKELRFQIKGEILKKLEISSNWGQAFLEAVFIRSGFSFYSDEFKVNYDACTSVFKNASDMAKSANTKMKAVYTSSKKDRYSALLQLATEIADLLPLTEIQSVQKKKEVFLLEAQTRQILIDRKTEWEPFIDSIGEASKTRFMEFIAGNFSPEGDKTKLRLFRAFKELSWKIKKADQ